MAEIGEALREARTRQRIEIAQMEAQTKIRAKYLRALENEDWDLLPGPTYVKSFLRTYGDMLGLDGRTLVADYKRSYEPMAAVEDMGQLPKHSRPRNAPATNRAPQWLIGGGVVIALAAAFGVYVALFSGDDPAPESAGPTPAPVVPSGEEPVTVVVRPTTDVTICARAGKRLLITEQELREGERSPRLRGRSVVVTLSARRAEVTVDGKRVKLPGSGSGPLTFVSTDAGTVAAPAGVTGCRS